METPELYHQTTGFCSQFYSNQEKLTSLDSNKPSSADHFMVEDLLDFSNEDDDNDDVVFDNITGNSTDSTITVVDSANSPSSFSVCEPCFNVVHDFGSPNFNDTSHLSSDLCVPYDDLAELEWLSNFVEESFSSEDLQKLQLISGVKAKAEDSSETENFQFDGNCNTENSKQAAANTAGNNNNSPIFDHEVSVPAKARTKRPRTAPCNWASRLLVLSPITSSSEPEIVVGPMTHHPKTAKISGQRRRDGGDSDGRKCLHCATDKTPQWRTGPLGPKTLCNACGVRYKSGRLVPEYRPAASPTFVLTKHSNSHRKVLELRRQKEMARAQQQQQQQQFFHHHHQNMMLDVSNGDEYLIHQHVGPDFRELI